ncbi:hypothetical protein [Cohnella herbarum]|uniref:Glycoside hydrolase family 42 N-terminal domain-containing protein n=1 Tax=Cohnella herbarum TaxID=2728023 RepID=A0A7Z2ZNY9_9BACL|nr:hypothetical protein [Cohnella herbarum]QJD86783.1 hypothetical protein HH215_28835 [Cohnella herbarum]
MRYGKWLAIAIAVAMLGGGGVWPAHQTVVGATARQYPQEDLLFHEAKLSNNGTISGNLNNVASAAISGTLIATLYDSGNRIVEMKTRQIRVEPEAGESFSVAFDTAIDPQKHRVKLFVWDSVQSQKPLAQAVDVGLYAMSEVTAPAVDPYAFYVGRVARQFGDKDETLSANLSSYIRDADKHISSITGQLNWDYGVGIAKVDAPASQGATGVLNAVGSIELTDVSIHSENDFGTVIVVPLDGKPIASSRKLLVQAFTEDKPYGFASVPVNQDGKTLQKITSLGTGPMNVKNVSTSVTLKGITDVTNVYALDMNGYYKEPSTGSASAGNYTFALKPNAMYTVVERAGVGNPYVPKPTVPSEPVYVWWEAEEALETNYPATSSFSVDTLPDTRDRLSGSDWLSTDNIPSSSANPPYAKYEVDVPENGTYTFYVRKFWLHGPFKWRFDNNEWTQLDRDITLLDDTFLRQFIGANWVAMGSVTLTKGKHRFEFALTPDPEADNFVSGMDSFLLTKTPHTPNGLLRPGEKLNLAEQGWWAFEPDTDAYDDSAILDLRNLNERKAGENGFVRKQGDKLLLGDGREVRFWAINAGTDVTNLEKPDVDYLASKLAKYGVNMVRIHGKIFDENGNIAPKALDKYHYFVSAMKKQGIYVELSYYFVLWWDMRQSAAFKGEGEQFYDFNKEPFGLIQFNKKQQELYKKGVRALLQSPNPYEGGLPLARDPAVAMIEVQNEDNYLFWTFENWRFPDRIKEDLFRQYADWLIGKYGSLDAAYNAWGPLATKFADQPEKGLMVLEGIGVIPGATGNDGDSKRRKDSLAFLTWSQRMFYEEMNAFLKDEIRTGSLIVASNWVTADPQKLEAIERYTYASTDIVDRHAYFESGHKALNDMYWTIQEGDTYYPQPAVRHPSLNPVKIVHNDKQPSMISEITWTNPTPYGAEGTYMLAVYGALQGIDALDMFSVKSPSWSGKMDKWPVMSPAMMGQFPAFALLYRNGYVKEAGNVVLESHKLDPLLQLKGSKIYESLNLDDARK